MRTKKINSRDFDFEAFLEAEITFIEDNFLQEAPDAADTMRYLYTFQNESNKAATSKDTDKWQMTDFKNSILQCGEVIFFPFSSGADLGGAFNLASGKNIQLGFEHEEDVPTIGLTDCYGFLVSLSKKDKFIFKSAIAWGDTAHSIEEASHPKVDKEMNGFLKTFIK
jgi:hypothetical protein